jgi:hypothetical protein
MTRKAIQILVSEGKLRPTGPPGRPGTGTHPNRFYVLPTTRHADVLELMKKKLDLSIFIVGVAGGMGQHAERAWWSAFKDNQWTVHPPVENIPLGITNYNGHQTTTGHNIDFVAEKDNIAYGVDVKNGFNYPSDLYWKFKVAAELGTIPLIVARWLNPGQLKMLQDLGGAIPLVYKDAMYTTTYEQLVTEAKQVLKVPVECRNQVENAYFTRKMGVIHTDTISNILTKQRKLQDFLNTRHNDSQARYVLGTR